MVPERTDENEERPSGKNAGSFNGSAMWMKPEEDQFQYGENIVS